MSGELTLSQFRNTTTQNNDFVIGNPIPSGSPDTATRALIFQVSDKIGPAYNPHIICEFVDSNWRIRLSDNGVTSSDFAFLNATQTFIGATTFSGTTIFTGQTTTRNITFGQESSDSISFVGTPTFSGPVVFSNTVTVNDTFTVNASAKDAIFNTATFKSGTKTLILNNGKSVSGGAAGLQIDNSGTIAGYLKTSTDNNGWELKSPNKTGVVRIEASSDSGTMIFKPVGGTFGSGVDRTFEFLNGSGKVGTYASIPSGGKVVVSSTTGFAESSVTSTKLGYLSGVTGDIQGQINSFASMVASLSHSVDYISGLTGPTGSFAGFIGEVSAALYSPTGVVQSSADAILSLKVAVGPTGAIASQIQGVSAALYSATGVLQSQASAIDSLNVAVGPTGSIASKVSGVSAALYSATGTIQSQASAINTLNVAVGPTGSIAQSLTQLTSGLSGATATISQAMSTLNGVTATWAIDANSQGHIAGIKLINGPTGSSFTINANKFQLLDNGTGTTGAPYSPFLYQNGVVSLNSQVRFTTPGLATGAFLTGWQNDLAALATGTTVIDGGRIITETVTANALATKLEIAGVIQSPNYVSPIPVSGLGVAAATGFKLSGTTFSTRYIGDSSNSDVQFELGTNANFGGYKVGRITEKTFEAQAISWYASMPNNWGGGNQQVTLTKTVASGTDVHLTSDFRYVQADIAGIYLINGHTAQSDGGCGNHDSSIEVWRKPFDGSSDVLLLSWHEPDCNGSTFLPYSALVSLGAGDRLYYKVSSKGGGTVVGQVVSLGTVGSTTPITITNTDYTTMAASGQTYPKVLSQNITCANAVGTVSYSITGGTGLSRISDLNSSTGSFKFNAPSTGSWTLVLSATDANNKTATKTITITVSAYVYTPLANTTSNYSDSTTTYPYDISQVLSASGSVPPYTWSIVSTTLPDTPVINGNILSATVDAPGTWSATLKVADSSSNELTFTLSYSISTATGGGGGLSCFDETTYILKADGTSCMFKDIKPGDYIKGINVPLLVNYGTLSPVDGFVSDVLRHEDTSPNWKLVSGIKTTPEHPWIITYPCTGCANTQRKGYWTRAENLNSNIDYKLVSLQSGSELYCSQVPVGLIEDIEGSNISMNLGTSCSSYFVGETESGPWYAVHNIKTETPIM